MEEPWEVCITLDFLVETSSDLCGCFKRGKEVKETYPTSGNNFPTPKDMISFMVCWVSFLWKTILVVNPYICLLLVVMISSLSSHSI